MSKLLLAFALGLTPAITLLAVMCQRRRDRRPDSGKSLNHVASKNLRSYVSRYVPAGPDRESALKCIDVLSGEEVPNG